MANPFEVANIGIRSFWKCSHCGARESAAQLAAAGDGISITPPYGWTVYGRQAICDRHVVVLNVTQRRIAA